MCVYVLDLQFIFSFFNKTDPHYHVVFVHLSPVAVVMQFLFCIFYRFDPMSGLCVALYWF